jgi:hypothetical protein
MIGIGGQIIGGYLMGQSQREQMLEDRKFKQQQLKMMMDAQKLKEQKEARLFEQQMSENASLDALYNGVLSKYGFNGAQPSAQGQSGTQLRFDDSFGPESSAAQDSQTPQGPDVAGLMADPIALAILKKKTGVDWLGAANANRQQGAEQRHWVEFLYRQHNDALNRQLKGGAGTWDEVDAPGGGQVPVFRPSNPQAYSGGLGVQPPNLGGGAPAADHCGLLVALYRVEIRAGTH